VLPAVAVYDSGRPVPPEIAGWLATTLAALAKVNPNQGRPGYETNCGPAAILTHQYLQSGDPALLLEAASATVAWELADLAAYAGRDLAEVGGYQQVIDAMLDAGEGAQAMLVIAEDAAAHDHVINVRVQGGHLVFLDGTKRGLARLPARFSSLHLLPLPGPVEVARDSADLATVVANDGAHYLPAERTRFGEDDRVKLPEVLTTELPPWSPTTELGAPVIRLPRRQDSGFAESDDTPGPPQFAHVDRGGSGRPAQVWIGMEPDERVASQLKVSADYVVLHGKGVSGWLVDEQGQRVDMGAVAHLLADLGLAGKKVLFLVCNAERSAQELVDAQRPTNPGAQVWAWSDLVWVSSGTGAALGGKARVTANGTLVVSEQVAPRRYVPGGGGKPAPQPPSDQLPLQPVSAKQIRDDPGPWSHRAPTGRTRTAFIVLADNETITGTRPVPVSWTRPRNVPAGHRLYRVRMPARLAVPASDGGLVVPADSLSQVRLDLVFGSDNLREDTGSAVQKGITLDQWPQPAAVAQAGDTAPVPPAGQDRGGESEEGSTPPKLRDSGYADMLDGFRQGQERKANGDDPVDLVTPAQTEQPGPDKPGVGVEIEFGFPTDWTVMQRLLATRQIGAG